MKQSWIIVCLVSARTCESWIVEDNRLRVAKINPALPPGPVQWKDYPHDERPDIKMLKDKGFHDFSLPFPSVQSPSNYDKDYIKDENGDNGEWQAQAEYDRLKGKLEKGNKAVAVAKQREGVEKVETDKLLAKVEELKKRTGAAKLSAEKKHKARQEMEQEEKLAWEKFVRAREAAGNMTWSKVPKDPVEKAKFMVKKEEIQMERCKEQLDAARRKLETAQKNYEHNVAERKRLGAQLKVRLNKEAEEEHEEAKRMQAREIVEHDAADAAAKVERDAVKKAAEAHTQAKVEKTKLDSDGEAVSMAKRKVDKAESELRKAECALRRYRNEPPCAEEDNENDNDNNKDKDDNDKTNSKPRHAEPRHADKKSDAHMITLLVAPMLPIFFAFIV